MTPPPYPLRRARLWCGIRRSVISIGSINTVRNAFARDRLGNTKEKRSIEARRSYNSRPLQSAITRLRQYNNNCVCHCDNGTRTNTPRRTGVRTRNRPIRRRRRRRSATSPPVSKRAVRFYCVAAASKIQLRR